MASMDGRVALVTGATGGIGGAIATALAREGARVVVVGRSPARAENAIRSIRSLVPSAELEPLSCDLSSQASIHSATREFLAHHETLDVLVSAAGVFRKERHVTLDGLELTFATNVMGYFLMTRQLTDTLKRAAAERTARVVNIASKYGSGPFTAKLDFDDLQTSKGKYSLFRSTPPTMLARVLLTQQFAELLEGSGVVVNAVHPGLVKHTNLLVDVGGPFRWVTNTFGAPAEKGADTAVWLATSPEGALFTGQLWAQRRMLPTPGMGSDPTARKRLWDECVRLTRSDG